MADSRAAEALQRIGEGEKLLRREPKTAYNGAAGVPIREEILARHGEVVVTRNGYGAECLNTPNVFFADIDFEERAGCISAFVCGVVLVIGAFWIGALGQSRNLGFALALVALIAAQPLAAALRRLVEKLRGGLEKVAKARIASFMQSHPDWTLRVYRTPAGFRLLAVHALFDPASEEVAAAFKVLGVDPVYATMCRNQQCFRARLTPKPWRIGISDHMRPRPGVWPIAADKLPLRQDWVHRYEAAAAKYASCAFLETVGHGRANAAAERVQELHDRLCHARESRPLA